MDQGAHVSSATHSCSSPDFWLSTLSVSVPSSAPFSSFISLSPILAPLFDLSFSFHYLPLPFSFLFFFSSSPDSVFPFISFFFLSLLPFFLSMSQPLSLLLSLLRLDSQFFISFHLFFPIFPLVPSLFFFSSLFFIILFPWICDIRFSLVSFYFPKTSPSQFPLIIRSQPLNASVMRI